MTTLGGAILDALEGREILDASNVETLGARIQRTTTRAGDRTYTLQGYRVHFGPGADGLPGPGGRFYVLTGGDKGARIVLDGAGQPLAEHARAGRGLSPEFREWIAAAVSADAPADHTGADIATRLALHTEGAT